jgi:hypothetical protein
MPAAKRATARTTARPKATTKWLMATDGDSMLEVRREKDDVIIKTPNGYTRKLNVHDARIMLEHVELADKYGDVWLELKDSYGSSYAILAGHDRIYVADEVELIDELETVDLAEFNDNVLKAIEAGKKPPSLDKKPQEKLDV